MFVDALDAEFYDEHHQSGYCYLSLSKVTASALNNLIHAFGGFFFFFWFIFQASRLVVRKKIVLGCVSCNSIAIEDVPYSDE